MANKPPTKVFDLQIGRVRYYNISVEAESAEQAKKAWEETEGSDNVTTLSRRARRIRRFLGA